MRATARVIHDETPAHERRLHHASTPRTGGQRKQGDFFHRLPLSSQADKPLAGIRVDGIYRESEFGRIEKASRSEIKAPIVARTGEAMALLAAEQTKHRPHGKYMHPAGSCWWLPQAHAKRLSGSGKTLASLLGRLSGEIIDGRHRCFPG
jgi:hypothetical protein